MFDFSTDVNSGSGVTSACLEQGNTFFVVVFKAYDSKFTPSLHNERLNELQEEGNKKGYITVTTPMS